MKRSGIGKAAHRPLFLYAVVRAKESAALKMPGGGVRAVSHGSIAAIVGSAGRQAADSVESALRHDRIVQEVFLRCGSVIPFGLGPEFQSEDEIRRMIKINARPLSAHLKRFHDRVEMGLKAITTSRRIPGLERIHLLAPRVADRNEKVEKRGGQMVFEGCYLLPRRSIDCYWSALDEIRRLSPSMPIIGSGPWAPFSFCDLVLRRATDEQDAGDTCGRFAEAGG